MSSRAAVTTSAAYWGRSENLTSAPAENLKTGGHSENGYRHGSTIPGFHLEDATEKIFGRHDQKACPDGTSPPRTTPRGVLWQWLPAQLGSPCMFQKLSPPLQTSSPAPSPPGCCTRSQHGTACSRRGPRK